VAECEFDDDLAAMRYCDDAAGLLGCPHLEFDPVADVSDGGLHPWFHVRRLPKMKIVVAIEEASKNPVVNAPGCYRTRQSRRNL
jgi:hypothetical protein